MKIEISKEQQDLLVYLLKTQITRSQNKIDEVHTPLFMASYETVDSTNRFYNHRIAQCESILIELRRC